MSTGRGLLLVLLTGLLLSVGCMKTEPLHINWDLTSSHNLDDVQWPKDKRVAMGTVDADLRAYEDAASVRVLFPDGRSFAAGPELKRVWVWREGEVVKSVKFDFRPLTLADALTLAKRLAQEWDIPTARLDKWYEAKLGPKGATSDDAVLAVGKTVTSPVKYQPSIHIRDFHFSKLPVVVALEVDWFKMSNPVSINWDLASSHNRSDVHWPKVAPGEFDSKHLYYDSVGSVRVLFPNGRSFVAGSDIREVWVWRAGEVIRQISFDFEPLTNAAALILAKRLAQDWEIPTAPLDKWYEQLGQVDVTLGGPPAIGALVNSPAKYRPSLHIRYSSDDQFPAILVLTIDWFTDNPK